LALQLTIAGAQRQGGRTTASAAAVTMAHGQTEWAVAPQPVCHGGMFQEFSRGKITDYEDRHHQQH
jgi:hypothetical protein